jgi:hypothetical protein
MGIGAIGIGGMSAARTGTENAVTAIRTLVSQLFHAGTQLPCPPCTAILALWLSIDVPSAPQVATKCG